MFEKFFALAITVSAVSLISGCDTTKETTPTNPPSISDSPKLSDIIPENPNSTMKITYHSENGEKLDVIYNTEKSSVTVIQSNGKQTTLPQALAASGIRYTKDEKTVFWSKGPKAQFYIDDKLVFNGREKE